MARTKYTTVRHVPRPPRPEKNRWTPVLITKDPLGQVPSDVAEFILSLTRPSVRKLVRYLMVSKGWYEAVSNSNLWKVAKLNMAKCSKSDLAIASRFCDGKIGCFMVHSPYKYGFYSFREALMILTVGFTRKVVADSFVIEHRRMFEYGDINFLHWVQSPRILLNFEGFTAGFDPDFQLEVEHKVQEEFLRNTEEVPLVSVDFNSSLESNYCCYFSVETFCALIEKNCNSLQEFKMQQTCHFFNSQTALLNLARSLASCKDLKYLLLWNLGTEIQTYNQILEILSPLNLELYSEYNPHSFYFSTYPQQEQIYYALVPKHINDIDDFSEASSNLPTPSGFTRESPTSLTYEGSEEEGIEKLQSFGLSLKQELFSFRRN